MRRALIVAWAPVAVLLACLAASTLAGIAGYRALRQTADAQLAVAGDYVAHHFQSAFVSRLRALEGVAAIDGRTRGDADREAQRRTMIDSLVRLHPELVWVGFAERPGRVAVAYRDLLAGSDVSGRDWWTSALDGPFIGGAHDALLLAPALAAASRPGGLPEDPPRLLDIAVPLRRDGGEVHGVLAAHVDARWVLAVRDEMAGVAAPMGDVSVLLLERDGSTPSGRRLSLDPPSAQTADGIRRGTLDGVPRTFSVHAIDGDVVVSRLGWRVAVGRDPELHDGPARRFLGWSIAGGAIVGAIGAVAVGLASGVAARRPGA